MKHTKLLLISLVLLLAVALFSCGIKLDVNFVVDGEVYATVSTRQNELIEIPTSPTKENYTFDGWYWDKDVWQKPFTANSLLDAPISDNMSVYAKWRPNTVKVTLELSGGSSAITSVNVKYGEKIGALPTPTKPYYTFTGWVAKDGSAVTNETVVDENLTYITATWKMNTYTVTFDADNGEDSTTKEVTFGSKLSAPFVTKPKHTLVGWYNGDTQWNFNTDTVTESITLTAKWEPFSVSVVFNANGGELSQLLKEVDVGSAIGSLPTPTRDGYVFEGWFEKADTDFENKIDESFVVTDDMELVAKWVKLITVEFINDMTVVENQAIQIEAGASLGDQLFVPTRKDNAIFIGWYNGAEKITDATKFNNDTSVVAVWSDSVICAARTYKHRWSAFDYTNAVPTCSDNGTATHYCSDCGLKKDVVVKSKLGHDYEGFDWELDSENPLQLTRTCARCQKNVSVVCNNLRTLISQTKVDGVIYGVNNVGCLYNENWTETTGTFCAANGSSVTVTITFSEATEVDFVLIKGAGGCRK